MPESVKIVNFLRKKDIDLNFKNRNTRNTDCKNLRNLSVYSYVVCVPVFEVLETLSYLYVNHLNISFILGFLPYMRMPTL